MPEVSIIIPVYQVEDYIFECLNSILNQTYTDYEVILIDDGSVDTSGIICENFARRDNRFKVFHQSNQGVSAARNKGIELSTGTYISFIDPDDFLERHMYEHMVSAIKSCKVDLVICGINVLFPDGRNREIRINNPDLLLLNRAEVFELLFSLPQTIGFGCWNKLFRKENIISDFDTTLNIGEDALFLFNYIRRIEYAACIPQLLYYYRKHGGSAMSQKPEKLLQSLNVFEKMGDLMELDDQIETTYCRRCFFDKCVWLKQRKDCDWKTRKIIRKKLKKYFSYIFFHRDIPMKEKMVCLVNMLF